MKAVVLAAGKGTRMKSELPKVLHEVAGRSMVNWVLAALKGAGVDETTVVIGHGADAVVTQLPPGATTAIQAEQLGTAHATKIGLAEMTLSADDVVIVLPGDMPLIRSETLAALLSVHTTSGAVATLLSSIVDDPTGYGRILRDDGGAVTGVVEHKDASGAQRAIQEVATGVYAFSAGVLRMRLEQVTNDNAQGEYYLPDVIGLLAAAGQPMAAVQADPYEGLGVNSHEQLAGIARLARSRINAHWMSEGVWMLDPDRV
ncbi:MAG: NTP transferase domain-containing protein, partial [Acidimicrobiia bacterium]|nr:NTP transferase domain-containing protein [Acidimicrobiia bacterium]